MESTFGRPTPLCGLEAWRLFLSRPPHGQAGEAKPRSRKAAKGTGREREDTNTRVLLSFLRLPLLPSPESWLTGFVGFVRFVVQGSEVSGPRMTRKTRMGSRKDAKGGKRMPFPSGLGVFAS
jgi:hypothetical protein